MAYRSRSGAQLPQWTKEEPDGPSHREGPHIHSQPHPGLCEQTEEWRRRDRDTQTVSSKFLIVQSGKNKYPQTVPHSSEWKK